MSRPYLYHYAMSFPRSHGHSRNVSWKEVQESGFQPLSSFNDWHHVFMNDDTLVVVSNVPTSGSETHVHVVAASNADASASSWAKTLFEKIKTTGLVPFD